MKIIIKGGVWKNTEDEILKASVMKYGKMQWSRVASLLSRKTAGQCKARWYEWLDPGIKKTEWTKEEEEKLLVLAKTLPMQWRTIAPLVGRTPAQCLEHYEKLIDKAMGRDDDEDPRKLRPGEIDPNPETQPARPDPVDMDDDEKEMLSEARARLASTKGKKAKRKAREKQMEDAKRLSTIQKRRELRSAGIDLRFKGYKKRLTSTTTRRFRLPVQFPEVQVRNRNSVGTGFYDTAIEDAPKPVKPFQPVEMSKLEEQNRDEEEVKSREKDRAKFRSLQKMNPPEAIMQMNQLDGSQVPRKRMKLSLPEPILSDQQLQDIVKSGAQPENMKGGSQLTTGLIAPSMTPTPMRSLGRTPLRSVGRARLTHRQELIMQEARNIAIAQELQTPLLGGERPELKGGLQFQGFTPKAMPPPSASVLRTPMVGIEQTPLRGDGAPLRDDLGLNDRNWERGVSGGAPVSLDKQRESLRQGLMSLPEPQNEYTLKAPSLPADNFSSGSPVEEDAEEADRRKQIEEEKERERELQRRSQVLQRSLPRPDGVTPQMMMMVQNPNSAEALLLREMSEMITYDNAKYPKAVSKESKEFTDEELDVARLLLDSEISDVQSSMEKKYGKLTMDAFTEKWLQFGSDYLYHPEKQTFVKKSEMSDSEIIQSYRHDFTVYTSVMGRLTKKIQSHENKVKTLLQGHIRVNSDICEKLKTTFDALDTAQIELECFRRLEENENRALLSRKTALSNEVAQQKAREYELQQRYSDLSREYQLMLKS